ncbi:MAG: lipocalin-like domain-containing protein [Porticoccaceae bacterium]
MQPGCLAKLFLRLVVLLGVALAVAACDGHRPAPSSVDVTQALGGEAEEGFERAMTVREFHFPADHGPHPEFRNEWWYITGHGRDERDNLYGFQITFFRIAIAPDAPRRASAWAGNQVWMAHAAVTDVASGLHLAAQRYSRAEPGLAGAAAAPFRVWLGDWQLTGLPEEGITGEAANGAAQGGLWHLSMAAEDFALELTFNPAKPVVLQGDRGLSQKSGSPGNASYYYSIPRLDTGGELTIGSGGDKRVIPVTGMSWLDREWGTSALGADQSGWDWFSLQLDSGRDLMFYRLRDTEGGMHGSSLGTWIEADGSSTVISPDDIRLTPLQWWRSPGGRRYPVSWSLNYPGAGADWIVRALLPDQEMNLAVIYWEGLVEVLEPESGRRLGLGYLEMTGY